MIEACGGRDVRAPLACAITPSRHAWERRQQDTDKRIRDAHRHRNSKRFAAKRADQVPAHIAHYRAADFDRGDDTHRAALDQGVEANVQALARYAALCQEVGLVPVVEPEVLMDGEHSLERSFDVTEEVLRTVFNQLYAQRVLLEGMILKPNMVLPGLISPKQEALDGVAAATVKCLLRAVPAALPGIAFLSGGQPGDLASARLNAMNVRFKSRLPWPLSFSFARAIQQPSLEIWRGVESHVLAAQDALYHRASCDRAARRGEYDAAMERT